MAKDATAGSPAPDMNEDDYEALLRTLSASAPGRAFLAEFARRNRAAETETLLAAMARLEAMVAAQHLPAAEAPFQPTTADTLVEPIADEAPIEPATAEAPTEPATADTLVEPIAAEAPAEPVAAEPPVEPVAAEAPTEPATAEPPAEPIAAEPPAEPIAAEPPVEPVAAEPPVEPAPIEAPVGTIAIPEVTWVVEVSLPVEQREAAATAPATSPPEFAPIAPLRDASETATPPRHSLTQIMSLSEDERVALFS
jgi:hypothetical protein